MTKVQRIGEDNWELLRATRLAALADAPYAFGSTLAEESALSESDWRLMCSKFAWFVASSDGDPCGLVAGADFGEHLELISMWVAPNARGTGVAPLLVETTAEWARSQGAEELRMGVAEGNARAERFYAKLGLTPTGETKPLRSNPSVQIRELAMTL